MWDGDPIRALDTFFLFAGLDFGKHDSHRCLDMPVVGSFGRRFGNVSPIQIIGCSIYHFDTGEGERADLRAGVFFRGCPIYCFQ